MKDESKRSEWIILGRKIGTATGWDGEEWSMMIYEFEPAEGVNLPKGDLGIDFNDGIFETYDEEGNGKEKFDMIEVMKDLPKWEES